MPIIILHIWSFTFAPTWYGLMYALSFYGFFLVMKRQKISEKNIDILLLSTLLGVIIWWRMGYIFLYNFSYYRDHVIEIFMPWRGGMSFHGGAIWVILAWYYTAYRMKISFLKLSDQFVWIVPFWLLLWRIGNFINNELFWLPGYSKWWAKMIDGISYFPTPLLEWFLEWFILWGVLCWKKRHITYPGQLGVWFLGWYGIFRFVTEFFRTPDIQIGYLVGNWMTLGHILSLWMIVTSVSLHFFLSWRKKQARGEKS